MPCNTQDNVKPGENTAMKKTCLIITIVAVTIFGCAFAGYQIVIAKQLKSMRVLGWEGDRYLWMAGTMGVVRWDVDRQVIINRSLGPDGISHFFTSSERRVWAYGDGVWLFDSGKWIELNETVGLQRGLVHDLGQLANGTIWVATQWGFKSWNQETRLWESMLVHQPASTLVEGQDNTLWFGSVDDGVIRVHSGNLAHFTTADGLVDNRIESMLAASDNTIWVGTRRGVSHWDGKNWQAWEHLGYPDPDGLVVYELYETSDGIIWATTSEDFAR